MRTLLADKRRPHRPAPPARVASPSSTRNILISTVIVAVATTAAAAAAAAAADGWLTAARRERKAALAIAQQFGARGRLRNARARANGKHERRGRERDKVEWLAAGNDDGGDLASEQAGERAGRRADGRTGRRRSPFLSTIATSIGNRGARRFVDVRARVSLARARRARNS